MSLKHKDNRRSLYEYKYPVTKLLVFHEDAVAGDHYHKERDELFILLKGSGKAKFGEKELEVTLLEEMEVKAGIHHTFTLTKDSILLEFATKEYDPTDDYK